MSSVGPHVPPCILQRAIEEAVVLDVVRAFPPSVSPGPVSKDTTPQWPGCCCFTNGQLHKCVTAHVLIPQRHFIKSVFVPGRYFHGKHKSNGNKSIHATDAPVKSTRQRWIGPALWFECY
ncbi:hypothetical protein DPEC_G00084800 [Dallia pectoralis]|uniref:Uncharacterized protein n=1 Tax=Dallia pectoralis TaxID=75939 RepID=A0ACC2GZC0_DALPE|nr:hypothetical protein DPEC_G00084800 [Dallia pectoralis]